MNFTAIISGFEDNPIFYESHIPIPEAIFKKMEKICIQKRVICTLNSQETFHAAMLPKGDYHYILLNKERLKRLQLSIGQKIEVKLEKDESEYGMDITEEMKEVLFADPEGNDLFQKLTPGKKRTLIHLINKIKNTQKRIEKSFIILDHLKKNNGNLEFKILGEDFKNNRFNITK